MWCSPRFEERSDQQIQPHWPDRIMERVVTETCRNIIVNATFIGQSCFDALHEDDSAADIIQSCVTDVLVRNECNCVSSLKVITVPGNANRLRLFLHLSVKKYLLISGVQCNALLLFTSDIKILQLRQMTFIYKADISIACILSMQFL